MTIKQQGGIFGRNPAFNDVEVNKIDADNIRIDGNTISSTNSNGDINVSPNGSGREILTGALELRRTTALSNYVDNFDNPLIYSSYAGGNIGVNSALVLQPRGSAALPIILANGNGAGNMAARLRVEASGDVTVSTGNLVIGTSGKGIDFSATSGTGTSELFDDYEEGTWTPADNSGAGLSFSSVVATYTKTGRMVVANYILTFPTTADGTTASISGLPFSANSLGNYQGGMVQWANAGADLSHLISSGTGNFGVRNNSNGTDYTNANLSGNTLRATLVYFV